MSNKGETSISGIVREYLKNNPEMKDADGKHLIDKILKETEVSKIYKGSIKNLRGVISKARRRVVVVGTNKQPKEIKTPYKVIGDKHYFFPIKGEFHLPNKVVDQLFYNFSKHGLDLSTTQMINKFNLEPWQWHALKNALKLYKASNIFSPHTVASTDPEEMKELVREKLDERINTLGYIVEDEYNKSIIKKYKDVIKKSTQRDLMLTSIMNEVVDLLPKVKRDVVSIVNKSSSDDEIVAIISDMHFGIKNKDEFGRLPDYSINKLKEYLDEVVLEVNKLNAKNVHVVNLGDIIETFQGNNHIGSWKGIEEGYYGSTLVIECYKLIIDFLSKINNLTSYSQVPGNHDRSSSSNKEDVEGFVSRLVFEFVKNSFSNTDVKFLYDEIIVSHKVGNINYLVTHGHLGISKTPPSELILEYAKDPKSYTVLLQGHLHSRKIKRDHKLFRDIIVPALMPGNHYSVTSGFSSNPGFMIIKENEKGKPNIMDYSL